MHLQSEHSSPIDRYSLPPVSTPGASMAIFVLAHIPLGLLMHLSPWGSIIATVHALAVTIFGLHWAINRQVTRVIYSLAYIAGAEVLWRMNEASVFWEYAKYAIALVVIVTMIRMDWLRYPGRPLVYFLLLLPSTIIMLFDIDLDRARDQISFNLSGPFTLMLCAWFFIYLRLSENHLQKLFLSLIAPVTGIAAIAMYTVLNTSNIFFSRGSANLISSGGFGPNQVSTMLGLAVMLLLLYLILTQTKKRVKLILVIGLIIFTAQTALTFSRGGLLTAAGGASLAFFFLLGDKHVRIRLLFLAALLAIVAYSILVPQLDEFSHGELLARFQNTSTSGRSAIIMGELRVWQEYPLFGVGPGQAAKYYSILHIITASPAAHTEYTRTLAEHGLFGLLALLVLLSISVSNLKRARTAKGKALVAALSAWALLSMVHSAMRLASPSLIFGLASIEVLWASVFDDVTEPSRIHQRNEIF